MKMYNFKFAPKLEVKLKFLLINGQSENAVLTF